MSSAFRTSCLAIALGVLTLAACNREEHHSRAKPIGETVPAGESPDTIVPGGGTQPLDPRAKLYDNNANAIAQGQQLIGTRPWLELAPGIAIILTVLSLNVFGDGLRDALDPRAKVRMEH